MADDTVFATVVARNRASHKALHDCAATPGLARWPFRSLQRRRNGSPISRAQLIASASGW